MTAEKVDEWRDNVDSYVADEEEVPRPSCVSLHAFMLAKLWQHRLLHITA